MKNRTVLFDINETVLDLSTLKVSFDAIFKGKERLDLWFSSLLHSSNIAIMTNIKTNFAQLAQINLNKLLVKHSVASDHEGALDFLNGFSQICAHDDIIPALKLLRDNQFQIVALSNSSKELLSKQISNAGLAFYFDKVISVEVTASFKPDQKVYAYAAAELAIPIEDLTLVAVHDWDTHGALYAGMKAAFLARKPTLYNPLFIEPTITGTSMVDIAQKLVCLSAQSDKPLQKQSL